MGVVLKCFSTLIFEMGLSHCLLSRLTQGTPLSPFPQLKNYRLTPLGTDFGLGSARVCGDYLSPEYVLENRRLRYWGGGKRDRKNTDSMLSMLGEQALWWGTERS